MKTSVILFILVLTMLQIRGYSQSTPESARGTKTTPYQELYVNDFLKLGSNSLFLSTPGSLPSGCTASGNYELFANDGDLYIQSNPGCNGFNTILNAQGGNVGIGTDNPQSKLHVKTTSSQFFAQLAKMRLEAEDGNSTGIYDFSAESNGKFFLDYNDGTSTSNRLVIDNTGNFGIGNSTPTADVQIHSAGKDISGTLASTGTNEALLMIGHQSQPHLSFDGDEIMAKGSGTTASTLWLNKDGGDVSMVTNTLYVDGTNMKVGIGTSAPAAQLHIQDGGLAAGARFLQIGDDVFLSDLDYGNTLGIYGVQDATKGKIHLGNTGPTLFGSNGNFGVGVDPAYTLDVSGTSRVQGDCYVEDKLGIGTVSPAASLDIDATNASNTQPAIRVTAENSSGLEIDLTNNAQANPQVHGIKMFFNDGNQTAFDIVDKSLNQGVGHQTFVVRSDGKVWATEITVKIPPFPDYVFDKDYELLSLEELQKYIEENGHLPGIKSADEVAEEGIGVGELQHKLLEKVEELTLYLLEQEKRLRSLEQENAALRKQH